METDITRKSFTFIGGGNMATALFAGLLKLQVPPENITIVDPNEDKLKQHENNYHIKTASDHSPDLLTVDYIFLCVKPQLMQQVCDSLSKHLPVSGTSLISVAAGITTKNLEDWLGNNHRIIRSMPNTPALYRKGSTAIFSNEDLDENRKNEVNAIFNGVGISIWVDHESALDTVTAVSGSGPAYFFRMMEAMQETAVMLGLNPDEARLLISQTALGAAYMVKNSDQSISQLRKNVTSKGGTTAAALESMTENEFDKIMADAIKAAHRRSRELSGE